MQKDCKDSSGWHCSLVVYQIGISCFASYSVSQFTHVGIMSVDAMMLRNMPAYSSAVSHGYSLFREGRCVLSCTIFWTVVAAARTRNSWIAARDRPCVCERVNSVTEDNECLVAQLFIHCLLCLTTGPQPLSQRVLHNVQASASSFILQ
jgi:hypothetical protein